ncbi:MAG TPA: Tol-Pal system beta propeller repeat protein TolB [Burkholderiales bacterium]|nr:Tol-Pal system beta propeller repeat protein TolB [Burkholderiales bacterium]
MTVRTMFVAMLVAMFIGLAPTTSRAILTIEITQGVDSGIPVAVVPFAFQGLTRASQSVSDVVEADLARSGLFKVLPDKEFPSTPGIDNDVKFSEWRSLKLEGLVIGSVTLMPSGKFQVEFRLYDVFKQNQLAGYRYLVPPELLRTVGHQIADLVYEKLTGERGAFNTRIAYITKDKGRSGPVFKLQIADSDGYNPQTIVTSNEPMMSPAWSPDGQRLSYVSFEDRRAKVYLQTVSDGRRELIAQFSGINSAPAFSPDGKRLALTLSRDGNPEIYLYDLGSRQLTRLTNEPAIDTEPAWSPDGNSLVFTSDRSGRPQIYRIKADGGPAQRLTFEGDYNARASFAPDGKLLTLVSGRQGRYHIATLQPNSGALQVLTDTPLDESPTFAPNGRMVLYATEVRGRGVLASVSADGRVRQLYRSESGDVREPAWSPYNRELKH